MKFLIGLIVGAILTGIGVGVSALIRMPAPIDINEDFDDQDFPGKLSGDIRDDYIG